MAGSIENLNLQFTIWFKKSENKQGMLRLREITPRLKKIGIKFDDAISDLNNSIACDVNILYMILINRWLM